MGQEIAIGALLNFQSWCFNSCSLCPEILIRSCLIFARVFGIFLHFLFFRPKSWMRRIIMRVHWNEVNKLNLHIVLEIDSSASLVPELTFKYIFLSVK